MMNWAKVKQSVVSEESAPSAWDVADVDKRDANGKTALLNACEKGDASICRLLLIQRASPDACATDGQSPLYLACRAGSLECARMLLQRQRGCINLATNAGFSPLFVVAQKGHAELLQLLLEERADVNLNAKDGRTPLYAACECGHHTIASRLLRLGIPVDATRTGGSTALVAAVRPPLTASCRLITGCGLGMLPHGRRAGPHDVQTASRKHTPLSHSQSRSLIRISRSRMLSVARQAMDAQAACSYCWTRRLICQPRTRTATRRWTTRGRRGGKMW